MNSHSSSSSSSENDSSNSVDFSCFSSSKSQKPSSSVPQQLQSFPYDRSQSSYEGKPKKYNKKKTKKKPLKKTKTQKKDNQTNLYNFMMTPIQATYITKKQCPKSVSLQNINPPQRIASSKRRGNSGSFILSDSINISFQSFEQGKMKLSEAYYFVQSLINEMLKDKEISQFFKKSIDEITQFGSAQRYYFDYKKIIPKPLNLILLLKMIQQGQIKNYIEFRAKFDEMIWSSRFYHTLKGNLRMISNGEYLQKRFEERFCQQLNSEGNLFEEEMIKTLERKKAKGSNQTMQSDAEKQINLMDTEQEYNTYRLHVLNVYLKKTCIKNQRRIQMIHGNIQNIIKRYPNSLIEIRRNDQKIQTSQEKKKSSKKCAQLTGTQSISKSPYSSSSDIKEESEAIYYQIEAKKIEVNLFQQLKAFVAHEHKKQSQSFAHNDHLRDQHLRMMYPRQDSEDFDSQDESDGF